MTEKTVEKPTADREEIAMLAFEIYSKRAAAGIREGSEPKVAIDAFAKAEAFVAAKKAYVAGRLTTKKPAGPQLADCFCPNQKRTHPVNMVSQEWGSLEKVAQIKAWLDKNATDDRKPVDVIAHLEREFPSLGWGMPEINTAKTIFPAYCAAT